MESLSKTFAKENVPLKYARKLDFKETVSGDFGPLVSFIKQPLKKKKLFGEKNQIKKSRHPDYLRCSLQYLAGQLEEKKRKLFWDQKEPK